MCRGRPFQLQGRALRGAGRIVGLTSAFESRLIGDDSDVDGKFATEVVPHHLVSLLTFIWSRDVPLIRPASSFNYRGWMIVMLITRFADTELKTQLPQRHDYKTARTLKLSLLHMVVEE